MALLKIDMQQSSGTQLLALTGDINEDSAFPASGFDGCKEMVLDFSGVTALNSCGIREWVRWVKSAPAGVRIAFVNCPKIVVDQINMVDGFLPKGAAVRSFQVPFFCEKCELADSALFRDGHELKGVEISVPVIACKKCREPMELDVIEAKYFKFVKNRK